MTGSTSYNTIPFGSASQFRYGVCTLQEFDDWWVKIRQHLFTVPVGFYCNRINSNCTSSDSKNFTRPPSPPRKLKRKKLTSKPAAKKAKVAEAIPMESTLADLDAAIDAASGEQSDEETTRQPNVQPRPVDVATDSPPKTGSKFMVITHRPHLRIPKPSVPSASADRPPPPIDLAPEATIPTDDNIMPTTTPIQPVDATPMVQVVPYLLAQFQDLDDFLPFDIGQFVDPSETIADALVPPSTDVRERLANILSRLDYPIDTLINDAGPIRSRIEEIQDRLPDDLIDAIAPAGYIESRRICILRARQQIIDHTSQIPAQAKIQVDGERAITEKAKLDELQSAAPGISAIMDELLANKADLEAQLAKVTESLSIEERRLADLPSAVVAQAQVLKSAVQTSIHSHRSLKAIPGTDAEDWATSSDSSFMKL
uniref:DUF1409 domain-containing protein n=1 Tax=Oryza brachyantha TaxID=4533 RepID=J3KUJ3_ORYBR